MGNIVLGMWTTHDPTLNTKTDQWVGRVKADLARKHWFKGEELSFDELVERRADENISEKFTEMRR